MTLAQKKLLELFIEIDDICKRHDIVYYIAGGSLIGAIRHRGFIPWDDDMDIIMTRDNWKKLIQVTESDIPNNRMLACQELNRDYPNMMGRYTDISTTAIHNNEILGDGKPGYVVDILILDPIPDKGESYKKYTEDLMLYSDLINPSLNYSYRYDINKKRYNKYYKTMKKKGKEAVLSQLEKEMFSYDEEKCDYYVMRWGGAPFIFNKDMYGSSRWGIFEGIKCRIPDRTGDYLTWHYGDDWMYIPRHDEQESHDAIFSLTTDYKTIQADYMKYIDAPKVRKAIIKRKQFLLKQMKKRHENQDEEVLARAVCTRMEIESKVNNGGFSINEALNNNEYKKLSDLFSEFYDKQLSRKYIGREDYRGIRRFNNPVFCGVNDEILYVSVMVLIHTNRIAQAARLIEVREKSLGAISEQLQNAKNLIIAIREAISDYDLNRKESAWKKTKTLFETFPNNDSLNMFYIRQLLEREDIEEAMALSKRALNLFPENGVYDKHVGDCLYRLGNKKEAFDCYNKALERTTNGYVIMEIEDIIKNNRNM